MTNRLWEIQNIAEECRFDVEGRAEGTKGEGTLRGWCAIGAGRLFDRLRESGFDPEIHVWFDPADDIAAHVYVVAEDHVVDVTATQFAAFKDQPVVIMHCKEAEAHRYYSGSSMRFKSVQELRNWQTKNRWPKNQIAWDRWPQH